MNDSNEIKNQWTGLHDLAYIYVVFGKVTDKVLKGEEVNEIIKSLQEWIPDLPKDDTQSIFTQALKRYRTTENWHLDFLQSLENVKTILSPKHVMGIISDLVNIAKSDERIYDTEKRLIGEIACVLIGDATEEIM